MIKLSVVSPSVAGGARHKPFVSKTNVGEHFRKGTVTMNSGSTYAPVKNNMAPSKQLGFTPPNLNITAQTQDQLLRAVLASKNPEFAQMTEEQQKQEMTSQ